MLSKYILFSTLILLATACEKIPRTAVEEDIDQSGSVVVGVSQDSDVLSDPLVTDENLLIFTADHTADTSFVLVLKKEPSGVRATYYELLPYEQQQADPSAQLFSFEGIRFTVSVGKWRSIVQRSSSLLNANPVLYTGRHNGSSYSIAHNALVKQCNTLTNTALAADFQELERYIRNILRKDIFQQKLRTSQAFAVK